MTEEPTFFESAASWEEARTLVEFAPRVPAETAGATLESLSVHVRDHKARELPRSDRSLEAHYGRFVLSQCHRGQDEARRWALEISYGAGPRPVRIAGREGRAYELGPEVPDDAPDGRSPAVVTWHDGEMHYLLASVSMGAEELLVVAGSMY